jgi:hypothetical protein
MKGLHIMSDVTKEILDQELTTVIELTDTELEDVNGGWGMFPQNNNSTAFAVTSVAFSQNNNECCPFFC